MNITRGVLAILWLSLALSAAADEQLEKAVRQYREALRDASPGELWVVTGEELFRTPRGPKNASLEACDFGLGPGVVKGAYAQLPRYFADTDRVEDLESRLMSCMRQLQGFGEAAFPRHARGDPRMLDFERLATYVAAQSNGMQLAAPLAHPKEVDTQRIGERLLPRFGHNGVLTPEQIAHLVALLLDPTSEVNR